MPYFVKIIQDVPLATKPSISLIILPLMRILKRNLNRTTDALLTHTTDTRYRHTLQTCTTDTLQTHYRHTLQTHTTNTHYRHTLQTCTTDTFLFISHTTNVLLFTICCNIFIGVRIIKEIPGSVASGALNSSPNNIRMKPTPYSSYFMRAAHTTTATINNQYTLLLASPLTACALNGHTRR